MPKLTNAKKRALAETLFIEHGYTAKAISEELTVTEKTVSNWRKGKPREKSWDERRAQNLSAPHKIKEILLKELLSVANGEDPKVNADTISKITKAIEFFSGKTSVQVVLSVLKEFDNWMIEQDPETAVSFLEWHKKFIMYKASVE